MNVVTQLLRKLECPLILYNGNNPAEVKYLNHVSATVAVYESLLGESKGHRYAGQNQIASRKCNAQ